MFDLLQVIPHQIITSIQSPNYILLIPNNRNYLSTLVDVLPTSLLAVLLSRVLLL